VKVSVVSVVLLTSAQAIAEALYNQRMKKKDLAALFFWGGALAGLAFCYIIQPPLFGTAVLIVAWATAGYQIGDDVQQYLDKRHYLCACGYPKHWHTDAECPPKCVREYRYRKP